MIDFFLCRLIDDEPVREQTHHDTAPPDLMEDLDLIELYADSLKHFAILAMTGSESIYTLRNKTNNQAKWKEAVDFLTEQALEEWKRIDAEGAILLAERNDTVVARRQEILAGEGVPVVRER